MTDHLSRPDFSIVGELYRMSPPLDIGKVNDNACAVILTGCTVPPEYTRPDIARGTRVRLSIEVLPDPNDEKDPPCDGRVGG